MKAPNKLDLPAEHLPAQEPGEVQAGEAEELQEAALTAEEILARFYSDREVVIASPAFLP